MQSWLPKVPALMQAWYPGQEGGRAIAEILFGDISPSGKLPATFEKRWEDNPVHDSYYPKDGKKSVDYSEGIFVGYRGYDKNNVEPQFPFGYGLSYTTFEYGTPKVQVDNVNDSPRVTVSFTLKNTGSKEAAEVAQVYLTWKNPRLPQAPKALKAFKKVRLAPGQAKEVAMELDGKSLSSFDPAQKKWIIDGDSFEILIGASSRDIRGRAEFRLIPERNQ
jgi:beta-glucosidase